MAEPEPRRHPHEFSALYYHFGPYGDQNVHVHPCLTEGCDRVLIGDARKCKGKKQPHRGKTLTA